MQPRKTKSKISHWIGSNLKFNTINESRSKIVEFLTVIWSQTGNIWQTKPPFLAIFDLIAPYPVWSSDPPFIGFGDGL